MKQAVATGQTDYTALVWLGDSAATDGSAQTAVAHGDITVYYARVETDNDVTSTQITMSALTALTDAHSDGGWFEVDSTNQPGLYRLDLPDGVFAAGAWSAVVTIIDAASNDIAPANLEFQLEPVPCNVKEIEGSDPTDQIRDSVVDDATRIDASALNTLSGNDPGSQLAAQSDVTGLNDPTAAAIADAVWDEDIVAAHNTADTAGALLDDVGTPGDFKADVSNLDAAISSRSSHSAADAADAVWDEAIADHAGAGSTGEALDGASAPSAATVADAVWDESTSGHTSSGTFGEQLKTDVDAILADTGTDGVVVASHTTAAKAEIEAEAVDALESFDLDHLIQVTAGSEEPTDGSYLDQVMHKSSSQTFDATTDSLEALRDTLSSASITTVTTVQGDTVTVTPYTTWEFTIDGLSDLSDAASNGVLFTVKEELEDADSAAILQVQEGTGLVYLDGSDDVTANKASLTVGANEDEITIHVNASQTGLAKKRNLVWDIKKIITASEDADQMAVGTFHIDDEAVTRALTT